jgi:hypothetical protein
MDVPQLISLSISILSLILAAIALHRSVRVKALDLRLELRKADNALRATVESLPSLLLYAKGSRSAVAAAMGAFKSGAMQIWMNEFESNLAAVKKLEQQLSAVGTDYSDLSDTKLEAKLVEVDALTIKANAIKQTYSASIAQDDRDRERLKDSVLARTRPT